MKKNILNIMIISALFMLVTGCSISNNDTESNGAAGKELQDIIENQEEGTSMNNINKEEKSKIEYIKIIPDYKNSRYKEIYLAGGCFWGVQAYIDRILGVEYTNVGYANGNSEETDYDSIKRTGHAETVYVVYDEEKITMDELLGYYYRIIEPTSLINQDAQYRSGIYYVDEEDKKDIEAVTEKEQDKFSKKILTEIQPLENYILAEDYHQKYFERNSGDYNNIDLSKISRVKPEVSIEDYPKPPMEDVRKKLTDLQFSITQESYTEGPFQNEYWDNEEDGLYTDIVTGEPLFLSLYKYDSGSGWPSFTRPIQWDVVTYYMDESLGMNRIEVRSRSGDSHLGHLFYDGPVEEGGLRYCINSGALDFVSADDLEERGYGKLKIFFE